MSPNEVKNLTNVEILKMLTSTDANAEAMGWLSALIADPAKVEGVRELSRRYAPEPGFPMSPTGRASGASAVFVDPDRWRAFLFKNRLHASDAGPLMEPERSIGWGHMVTHRGKTSYFALDAFATAMNMNTSDLIWQIGTDAERERLSAYV